MLRRFTSATCATFFLLAARPVLAAPPGGDSGESDAPADETDAKRRVERGIEAWRHGDWTEVRDLLEPIVREGDIADGFMRESALRYLAEATLLDEGLDPIEREELAHGYVTRLLDGNPEWTPPSGLHGRPFYDLVAKIRSERDAQLAEACRGQLLACEADLTELKVDFRAAQGKIAALQEDLANEDVFLTEVVKRNRGLAFLPFGVGHFTNGNLALGGAFLALEVATGAAALGLLIYRTTNYGCVRTDGFNRKSLECTIDAPDSALPALRDEVEAVRNAEAALGYAFLGAVIIDIALAQVLFKPIEVVEKGKKTRRELDAQLDLDEHQPTSDPKRRESAPRSRTEAPSARLQPTSRTKLRIQPHPAYVPAGLGLGVTLQF